MRTTVAAVAVVLLAAMLQAVGARQSSPRSCSRRHWPSRRSRASCRRPSRSTRSRRRIRRQASGPRAVAHRPVLREVGTRQGTRGLREGHKELPPPRRRGFAVAPGETRQHPPAAASARKGRRSSPSGISRSAAPPLELYGVSPDGKYVAYVDGNTAILGQGDLNGATAAASRTKRRTTRSMRFIPPLVAGFDQTDIRMEREPAPRGWARRIARQEFWSATTGRSGFRQPIVAGREADSVWRVLEEAEDPTTQSRRVALTAPQPS